MVASDSFTPDAVNFKGNSAMPKYESTKNTQARKIVRIAALPVAVIVSGAIVWGGSMAAFNSTTTNAGNTWTSGSLYISDDDSESAMFRTSGNIVPGYMEEHCITVKSISTVDSTLKLYADPDVADSVLGEGLTVTVTEGAATVSTSPVTVDCGNFTADAATTTTSVLNEMPTAWDDALGNFALAKAGSRSYRINVALPDGSPVEDNKYRDYQNAAATFVWEARSN